MAEVTDFKRLIAESRNYCKANILGGEPGANPILTRMLAHEGGLRLEDTPPDEVNAVCEQYRADTEQNRVALKSDVEAARANVHSEADMRSFRTKMAERKKKARAECDAAIDKAFDEFQCIGEKNPSMQSWIVAAAQSSTKLGSRVWGQISYFFDQILLFTWEVLRRSEQWIAEQFTNMSDTISRFVFFQGSGTALLA